MAYISQKERMTIPDSLLGDPAGKKFPARTQEEFDAATRLVGRAANPAAVKKRLIQIARKMKFRLPESWETGPDDDDDDDDDD